MFSVYVILFISFDLKLWKFLLILIIYHGVCVIFSIDVTLEFFFIVSYQLIMEISFACCFYQHVTKICYHISDLLSYIYIQIQLFTCI